MNYEQVLDRWARLRWPMVPERAQVILLEFDKDGVYVVTNVDGLIEATMPLPLSFNDTAAELVNISLGIIG